jgi:diacylglycerol kinase (ATP)
MPCLIVNPNAGGGRLTRWLKAHAPALQRAHPELQWRTCTDAAHARAVVEALPPGERVIVAGGDGTVQALLPLLVAGGHTLGLLPGGHGDDLARALGLRGLAPGRALHLAMTGEATPIDLGSFSELTAAGAAASSAPPGACAPAARTAPGTGPVAASVLFASSLCCGLDAAIAQRAAQARTSGRSWALPGRGLLRYLRATAAELRHLQPVHLQLRLDGRPVHDGAALFASVLNTASYGAGMRAAPRARPDDGQLDLLVAGRFTRWGVLTMLPRLLLGTHTTHAQVRLLPAETIEMRAERPLPLAADGEPLPPASAWRVQVLPSALPVVRRHSPAVTHPKR